MSEKSKLSFSSLEAAPVMPWRQNRSGKRIREHQKETARQEDGREKEAVVRPPDQAACMRDDQADKSDIAGRRYRRSRQERTTNKKAFPE